MSNSSPLGLKQTKGNYALPRSNVVLVSCMDPRLTNELSEFMDRDNLTNRYDHLIIAGAGLGIMHGKNDPNFRPWTKTFFSHLKVALELHHPEDVYIVEHRNCGAYGKLLNEVFDDSPECQKKERKLHRRYAMKLAKKICKWCEKQSVDGKQVRLRVNTFLMDLRGNVEHLDTVEPK